MFVSFQSSVFNLSELESVPNFKETFDCTLGQESSISLVVLQGRLLLQLHVFFVCFFSKLILEVLIARSLENVPKIF